MIVTSCTSTVFAATSPYVESDTTVSFTRSQNESYQVKFTVHGTHANPHIVAGNGSVLQTQNVVKTKDSSGNDVYYFKVKAIGAPGSTSAIYTTLSGQAAVQHFVITVTAGEAAADNSATTKTTAAKAANYLAYAKYWDEKAEEEESHKEAAHESLLNNPSVGAQGWYDEECNLVQADRDRAAKYRAMAQNAK